MAARKRFATNWRRQLAQAQAQEGLFIGCVAAETSHYPLLGPCDSLFNRYLYTSGFKSASNVTEEGRAQLRASLPPFATAALNHSLSRYLKHPE